MDCLDYSYCYCVVCNCISVYVVGNYMECLGIR